VNAYSVRMDSGRRCFRIGAQPSGCAVAHSSDALRPAWLICKVAINPSRGGLFIRQEAPMGFQTPLGVTCGWTGPARLTRGSTGHPDGVWGLGPAGGAINRPPLTGFKTGGPAHTIRSAQEMPCQMWLVPRPSASRDVGLGGASKSIQDAVFLPCICSLKAALLAVLMTAFCRLPAHAQLQVLTNAEPQRVFAGVGTEISVRFHNPGNGPATADLRTRLYQAGSAIAAPWDETPWKELTVLPGQTVLESAVLTFPRIKAETRFLVQWLDGASRVIGVTEVLVYPPDLLKDLGPLAGEEAIGAFDPQNRLKPLLKATAVDYQDAENTGLKAYSGKLVIVGPFHSQAQMREGLSDHVKALALKGAGVVWIQPPPEKHQCLKPSFYSVLEGKGAVVVAQADLIANLADSPQAQLNLIQLARLALHPEPLRLPQQTLAMNRRNIQQPTANAQHPMTRRAAPIGSSMFDVGCWMFPSAPSWVQCALNPAWNQSP